MDSSTNSVSIRFDEALVNKLDPLKDSDIPQSKAKPSELSQINRVENTCSVRSDPESFSEDQTSRAANQRLAMGCLAGLAMVFSIVSYLLQGVPVRAPESLVHPPRFLTEIPSAPNEEWMLLPGVGEKTASMWRNESGPMNSLEDLHGVGPVRAERLKPYVSNLAPQSKEHALKSKKTNPSPTKVPAKAQATDE